MALKGYSSSPKSAGLVSYSGNSLGESYPSAEIQSVYSIAPADWASPGLATNLVEGKLRI